MSSARYPRASLTSRAVRSNGPRGGTGAGSTRLSSVSCSPCSTVIRSKRRSGLCRKVPCAWNERLPLRAPIRTGQGASPASSSPSDPPCTPKASARPRYSPSTASCTGRSRGALSRALWMVNATRTPERWLKLLTIASRTSIRGNASSGGAPTAAGPDGSSPGAARGDTAAGAFPSGNSQFTRPSRWASRCTRAPSSTTCRISRRRWSSGSSASCTVSRRACASRGSAAHGGLAMATSSTLSVGYSAGATSSRPANVTWRPRASPTRA